MNRSPESSGSDEYVAATTHEASAIIDYVLSNHEWCSQPHRCDKCGGHLDGYCWKRPELPKCEGCEMQKRAALWVEAEARACGKPAVVDSEGPTAWYLCCNTHGSLPKKAK